MAHRWRDLNYSLDTAATARVASRGMQAQKIRELPAVWRGSAKVFAALGDEYRQRILLMCRRRPAIRLQGVFAKLPLSRTAIVHHIGVLRDAQLLTAEKRGGEVYLSLNRGVLQRAANIARQHAKR